MGRGVSGSLKGPAKYYIKKNGPPATLCVAFAGWLLESEEKIGVLKKIKIPLTISTGKLNALRHLHRPPINLVIYKGSIMRSNLGDCFPLRCFQRLSDGNIATQQCSLWNNWHTRDSPIPVLSY